MRDYKFRAFDKVKKEMICIGFHIIGEVTVFGSLQEYVVEYIGYRFTLRNFWWSHLDIPNEPFSEEMIWKVIGNVWVHPELLKGDEGRK